MGNNNFTSEDFRFNTEVESNFRRLKDLLGSKILWDRRDLFFKQSVFIEVLIIMKDLLIKAHKVDRRVAFTDDVIPNDNPRGKIVDVTDLINNFRDAACHIDSFRREVESCVFSYNEIRGRVPNAIVINDVVIGSDYEDDIAYAMGSNRMYLKRHLERAYEELKVLFKPIVENPFVPFK
ncbi:MAG TPA: hypothetical protein VGB63_18490 [Pedobacter sp.]|jgi:hypothetical protein